MENYYRITKLSNLDETQVDQAITIFVDGFYPIFSLSVSKDKAILHELFKDAFIYERVFICLDGDTPIGFLGIADINSRAIKLNLEKCQELFGKRQGKLLLKQMESVVEKINVKHPDDAYIDFITTTPAYRGKGIAIKLFEYTFATLGYKKYWLDVLSKNKNAKSLYEILGFKKVKTIFNPITFIFRLGIPILMVRE